METPEEDVAAERDMTHAERLEKDRTPAPALEKKVEGVVDEWFSALVTTVGPLVSTIAFNAISESRDNLKRQLAQALATAKE